MKVYAVVVWFKPREFNGHKNILSFSKFVDGLIIVDNSDTNNSHFLNSLPQAEYLFFNENRGIATALNAGYEKAISEGADWVLTMDQDSSFESDHIQRLIKTAVELSSDKEVAVISPAWQNISSSDSVEECNSVITSGSLVNLSAFKRISGYNEKFFIDEVDHEFCFRLKRLGYRILRVNNVRILHSIGELITIKFMFFQLSTLNHDHIRKYYMTRNRLYMRANYSEFGLPYLKMIITDFLRVMLIEENKTLKIKYMVKGAVDYFKGKAGKLVQKGN